MSNNIATFTQQCKPYERKLTERPKIGYDFDPVPSDLDDEISNPHLSKLFRIIMKFLRRGFNDPPIRLLMAKMKKGKRQVQRYINMLKELGKLLVTYRKIAGARNLTNIFSLPKLGGGGEGVKNDTEKKGEVLKTNTPTRDEAPRAAYDARKAKDERDRERMKQGFEAKRLFWDECKRRRLDQAIQRGKNALRACVGMAAQPTEFDPEYAADFWKREAERPRTLLELLRAGGGR